MAYEFDFGAIVPHWQLLLDGVVLTTELTIIGAVVGVSLGTLGAWARASRAPVISQIVGIYVELIRNTPFLVQLFFIFFGLPALGVKLSEFQAAVLAMIVNLGAYSTEIIRAGILAIPKGQIEAAAALGLKDSTTLRLVVIPQAMRLIIPPLTSQILNLTKNSSLAVAIAYPDLVAVFAGTVLNQTGQAIEVISLTMAVYLTLSLLTSLAMNWYNARIALKER